MKLGLVSDIHGHHAALQRALELLSEAEQVICLGDCINQHRFSNEVVGVLKDRQIPTIWGNHEAVFFGADGERARRASWIDPALLAWLGERPLRWEAQLAGVRVLAVHGAPAEPFGGYAAPGTARFREAFSDVGVDVVLCGHTHLPFCEQVGGALIVNPGSAGEGRPTDSGFTLSCALLDLTTREFRQLDFDV